MRKILIPIVIFWVLLAPFVLAVPQYKDLARNVTVPGMGDPVNISCQFQGSASVGVNAGYLSTNETGSWVNYTTTAGRYFSGKNYTSWTTESFDWTNSSLCNALVGFKIYFNDTAGAENVTNTLTLKAAPYFNASSWAAGNFTSVSCDDKNNISAILSDVPAGWFEVLMGKTIFDSTKTCAFNSTQGTEITITNQTNYCMVNVTHGDLAASTSVKIYKWSGLSPVAPPNLPAALSVGIVGTILVIYAITKWKRSG